MLVKLLRIIPIIFGFGEEKLIRMRVFGKYPLVLESMGEE